MSLADAERAMRAIEAFRPPSDADDERLRRHVAWAKEYLRRTWSYCERNGIPPTLFVDPTEHRPIDMPQGFDERLAAWETLLIGRNPFECRACRNHVRFLVVRDDLPTKEREWADLYPPLLRILEDEGQFYVEHCYFFVDDVAGIVLNR